MVFRPPRQRRSQHSYSHNGAHVRTRHRQSIHGNITTIALMLVRLLVAVYARLPSLWSVCVWWRHTIAYRGPHSHTREHIVWYRLKPSMPSQCKWHTHRRTGRREVHERTKKSKQKERVNNSTIPFLRPQFLLACASVCVRSVHVAVLCAMCM